MTLSELLDHIERQKALGGSVVALVLNRSCRGESARVVPGVRCPIVDWGTVGTPRKTTVLCDIAKIEPVVRREVEKEGVSG